MELNPYESPQVSGRYEEPFDDESETFWDRYGFWIQIGVVLVMVGWMLALLMLPPIQPPHPHRRYLPGPIERTEENPPDATSSDGDEQLQTPPATER